MDIVQIVAKTVVTTIDVALLLITLAMGDRVAQRVMFIISAINLLGVWI